MAGDLGRILCLEGAWDDELTSRSSVRPMLELLERTGRIEFVHRDVGTRAELEYYLERWTDDDPSVSSYRTLYLAFHGSVSAGAVGMERTLSISGAEGGEISLRELASILKDGLRGVVVHLGSCSVLAESDEVLSQFVADTGIKAIAGYTNDVDWMPSAAMDLLFFDAIAEFSRWDAAERALGRSTAFQALLADSALGFRIFPSQR